MRATRILFSLLLVISAVLIQTTVFHSVRPFGASPDLVLLMVIACVRWLKPEIAVLLGFTGGLMLDLFGTAPLGLQALAYTLVAYTTIRVGDRFNYGIHTSVLSVGVMTFLGLGTVALVGTLFGEGTLGSPGILKTLLLVPVYNTVFAMAVLPLVNRLLVSQPSARGYRPGSLS